MHGVFCILKHRRPNHIREIQFVPFPKFTDLRKTAFLKQWSPKSVKHFDLEERAASLPLLPIHSNAECSECNALEHSLQAQNGLLPIFSHRFLGDMESGPCNTCRRNGLQSVRRSTNRSSHSEKMHLQKTTPAVLPSSCIKLWIPYSSVLFSILTYKPYPSISWMIAFVANTRNAS